MMMKTNLKMTIGMYHHHTYLDHVHERHEHRKEPSENGNDQQRTYDIDAGGDPHDNKMTDYQDYVDDDDGHEENGSGFCCLEILLSSVMRTSELRAP